MGLDDGVSFIYLFKSPRVMHAATEEDALNLMDIEKAKGIIVHAFIFDKGELKEINR